MLGLILLYGFVLRPSRPLFTHGLAIPALQAATADRPEAFDFIPRRSGISVEVYRTEDRTDRPFTSWTAPPGLLFLLPGLFLVGLRPRRPYWAILLACHVGLGAIQVALLAAGIAWSDGLFEVYRFSQTYATETVGLGVPVLLYVLATRDNRPASTEAADVSGE